MDALGLPFSSRAYWYTALPFIALAIGLALTRIYTTWAYHQNIRHIKSITSQPGKKFIDPVPIPYTLPFLGNSLDFLNKTPGSYWRKLFSWHPRSSGACTLVLGGRRTHILYRQNVIAAMFKDKTLKRDAFERELYQNVFVMGKDQIDHAMTGKHTEAEMNAAYLTRPERVNELTEQFTKFFAEALEADSEAAVDEESVCLYNWLRDRMFSASTTALYGTEFFKAYPDFCDDFYDFDNNFMSFFFGFPDVVMRKANARRDQTLDRLEAWSAAMYERSDGTPVDPEGPAWEPLFGSRLNRARQLNYGARGLNSRSSANLNLGMIFAISSNAIPATGWMLMQILNPKGDRTLLGRVMAELETAEQADGSIDVPTLINSQLLQSIWTETLRLYTDVLIARNATQDTALPLDEDGKTLIRLRKGDYVFAPTIIGHRDPDAWRDEKAPVEEFLAERFLQPDPEHPDRQVFAMTAAGKFYPFGGGRTICPGRVFAKQEALGALAMVLLKFEFDVLGFVDQNGKETEEFVQPCLVYPGSAALVPGGDVRVKIRRRGA